MTRIALVTTAAARELDDDLLPLADALRARAADVAIVDWDDTAADWARYDIALLRSTWDYVPRLPEFLAWAARTAVLTRLLNPLDIVRWNVDKHYLAALEAGGTAIVPSSFVEPGDDDAHALDAFLAMHGDAAEFVVKPCVGAGSRDAQRHARDARAAASAHVARLLAQGRSVVLQPYLESVDLHGETALIFFDGRFSHAIRKGPLLRRGAQATRALFATEQIAARTPDAAEHAIAESVLGAIPFAAPLLYARVDLIRDRAGAPRLLELELTEPSLFFAHGAGSAARFAQCVLARATRS